MSSNRPTISVGDFVVILNGMPTNRLKPEEVEDEMKRYQSCLTVSTRAEYVIWLREFRKRENKFQQAANRIWLQEQLDHRLEVDYRFQTGEAENMVAKINEEKRKNSLMG